MHQQMRYSPIQDLIANAEQIPGALVIPLSEGLLLLEQAGELIWQEICEVAAGKLTKAEILGHQDSSFKRTVVLRL
ncbi:hypothetical protein A8709_16160 [Paenibacillus pectinilyticus]|uniref:Uncharacterized protein n=1 Tax=Paenibacillus pectinilyticus TaxID=512399 RepID=A0A1C1A4X9_9BACL|nr:hypothetical protein A8709_16160 [Paenibacillus pectinilyticus]